MFRKLHIQLTLFSTLITGSILLLMTLACLLIAEKGTRENSYTLFSNNVQSCISHLESQDVISHQWLLQAKSAYGIELEIRDRGNPLFFDKLNPTEEIQTAFQKAAALSRDTQGLDIETYSTTSSLTKYVIFKMDGCYAATARIPKPGGALGVVILYPLDTLNDSLTAQRLGFLAAALAAVCALALFSWFFTKKILLPLEENRKRQTEFIASASHELRSPLTVILSGLQAMEQASPGEIRRFTPVLKKEGTRMARLVNDMLSLANADNKSWSILPAPCELDTLLLDTCEKYEPLMQKKGLHLQIRLPGEAVEPCFCDSARIAQVLGILLDNALSYVPSGKKVCVSLDQNSQSFLITVSDNGPGIPDESKSSVFCRFYRQDSSRNDKQHFGLGLCIAWEIIQLHKGSIRLTDSPEGGAAFVIALPKSARR